MIAPVEPIDQELGVGKPEWVSVGGVLVQRAGEVEDHVLRGCGQEGLQYTEGVVSALRRLQDMKAAITLSASKHAKRIPITVLVLAEKREHASRAGLGHN